VRKLIHRPIRALVHSIHAHPYLYLLISLILSAVMLQFVRHVPGRPGAGLKLKSKIQDLLPESAPSVEASKILQERLGSADILVATLMTDQFEEVKKLLPALSKRLAAREEIVKVLYRQDITMIDQNALIIFPSLAELEDYYQELSDEIRKAVKKRLQLFDDDDEKSQKEAEPKKTYAWGELEQDDGLSNLGRTFRAERGKYQEFFHNRAYTTIGLQIFPSQSSGNLAFCQEILKTVDEIIRDEVEKSLGPIGPEGVVTRVDLGGGYRHALQESKQIQDDMLSSVSISLLLLALVIIIFFRSVRAFVCVMIPLIIGISWTMGLVALTVGYLNLITAFIFAVLLGLGIDFGIHFYGRYREERSLGQDPLAAMLLTHLETGEANILAAITTSIAFLALTLADFKGFSQFGGVAAAGVILCLIAVFILFTALIFISERWSPLKLLGYKVNRSSDGDIPRRAFPLGPRTLLISLVIAGLAFGFAPSQISFELNMKRLGQKRSVTQEYKKIQYGTTQSTSPAVIFADDAAEAQHIYKQLEERMAAHDDSHPRIKSYQALFALVPEQQAEKAHWVQKICRKLRRKVKLFEGDQREGADELLTHCEPKLFGTEALPDWVKAKFSDRNGELGEFIFVSPRGSTSNGEVALAFRQEMLSLEAKDGKAPVVSGKPLIWAEVILAMRKDGAVTSIASLLVVFLLLFLFERNLRSTFIILLPLSVGLGITALVMMLMGLKLNFFNMLALPTIIGMGVDDGVHLFHRYKKLGRFSGRYIVRTTGMSAVLTTLTTSIGFGSLLTANHYGLNSLGFLTMVGMSAALLTTLLVLPAAFQWLDSRKGSIQA